MKQNDTSVDYAQPDPADAYKQAFAAFSGAKWIGDPQYSQSAQVLSAAGALSKIHGLEALITEKDIKKIASEVMQRCMAAGVPPSEIDKLIATLKSNVGASKSSLEDIRGEALKAADDLVSEATGKASETPEAKAERIFQEAIKAEEKAQAESHEFDPYKTKDELAKEKAAEEKLNKATEEYKRLLESGASEAELEAARKRMVGYQKVLSEVRNDIYERIENDPSTTPEVREKIRQAKEKNADTTNEYQAAAAHKEQVLQEQRVLKNKDASVAAAVDAKKAAASTVETVAVVKTTNQVGGEADFFDTIGAAPATDTPPSSPVKLTDVNATHPDAAPVFTASVKPTQTSGRGSA